MERDTYTDGTVQSLVEKKYIPVKVDRNARPDLSNRFWNYALPGIVIFNSDGSEIVRQQGYMPARQMASMLQAVIDDPSPGPSVKPEPALQYSSSPSIDPAVLKTVQKSIDSQYDIPAQGWTFAVQYLDSEFVEYTFANSGHDRRVDDGYLRLAIRRSRQLIDPVWGGAYQSLVIPVSDNGDETSQFLRIQISGPLDTSGDSWNTPHFEKTAAIQAQAMEIFSAAYGRWHEESDLTAALNVAGYVRNYLLSGDGAFYTGQAGYIDGSLSDEDFFARDDRGRKAIGSPTIDKNIYASENGRLISALCRLYFVTKDRSFLQEGERSARWVMEHRALPGGGFSHGAHDTGGPVGRLYTHLFRCHVPHRAHHHSRFGSLGERDCIVIGTGLRLRQLRQPEVQNLHSSVFGDEQVLRLQIAMNNPFFMGCGKSTGDLHAVVNRFANWQTATLELLPQGFSFQ